MAHCDIGKYPGSLKHRFHRSFHPQREAGLKGYEIITSGCNFMRIEIPKQARSRL